jgi:hypothetical protein
MAEIEEKMKGQDGQDKKEVAEMIIRRTYDVGHLEPVDVAGHTVFDNQRNVYTAFTVGKTDEEGRPGYFTSALQMMLRVGGEVYIEGHKFLRLIDDETVEALDGPEKAGNTLYRTLDNLAIHGVVLRVPKTRADSESSQKVAADITSLFMYGTNTDGKNPEDVEKVAGTVAPKTATETNSA